MQSPRFAATFVAAGLAVSGTALATNGMIMEGYGPIASGMGGASMAYDNGTAAMANNPATLGMMPEGGRVDVMLGFVGPDLTVPASPMGSLGASEADAFYMPAAGYARKQGRFAYGIGIYGQGGMGTEYANGDMAQVSVGRVIFPLAYTVNDRFNVGGSVDFVWSGMDLVADIMPGVPGKEIQFTDDSDFTGEAKGYSLAAKLGFTYKLSDTLNLGAVYQTASNLPDLKDGAWKVKGFDMPPVVALGLAWQTTDRLMLVADVKDVLWGSSMNTVTIMNTETGLVVPFQQDWDDQIVVALGLAYRFTDAFTARVGYNYGKNPIPDDYVHYLWPATVETHYTAGFGYTLGRRSTLNFGLSIVPENTVTGTGPNNAGFVIEHSQVNWQLMYSHAL
ncbi:MAG TPA: outer membrane protein transport protein [Thiobacillaceae bacterium]|nr:outer membrane protein transport protein [Thiobacillaceae bacterium]